MKTDTKAGLKASATIVALAATTVFASSPKFFTASTQADFLKGDVENLSIDTHGDLTLGPATDLVYETETPFLWSLLPLADGTLFAGSGNDGKVFKIDPQGKGSTFFDSPELEVHALAPAPNGALYVGTSPDGKVYKVDRDGQSSTFFSSDDKYIWALALDARGNLYAGTGDKGVIYKIAPDGKSSTFYKAPASHVMALAFDANGNLIVGTGTPGKVLRVDASGKAFMLLDSPFQEIRALRLDPKGMLFVAAINGRGGSAGASGSDSAVAAAPSESLRAPVPSVSAEITSISIVDVGGSAGGSGSTREDRRSPKGGVYRITPDGIWDEVWESRDDSPYDLVFDQSGTLIVATGNKGKIYRLEGDPLEPTLLARAAAQQVTALYKDPHGRLYYTTANPGKVYRLSSDRATRGTYESDARDAQMIATWGALSWRGTTPAGTSIEVSTRSGNTETPDDTWSAWSSPTSKREGTTIVNPKARYVQWRAVLTGTKAESPVLTSVTVAYLQRNLRPTVRSITIHPPGIVFQKPFSTGEPDLAGFEDQWTPERRLAQAAAQQGAGGASALGRRSYQKGLQTIVWKADDDNDDELSYDILYRREGETTWKTLRKGVTESILVWDTTTVPNGTYFIKVVASDAPSNPLATALAGELESSAFEIDNTPPVISVTSVRVDRGRTLISFDVTDDHSPVQRVEFSSDGQRWRGVFPVDGIADSREEHFELPIDGELGDKGLTLRASDTMNNIATAHVDAPRR